MRWLADKERENAATFDYVPIFLTAVVVEKRELIMMHELVYSVKVLYWK